MPDSLTIYLDTPIWWWRGRRWCHLISDTSIEDLHQFASEIKLRYMSFGFDHYDLPEDLVEHAMDSGAQLIDPREIVRKLRAAGLRTSHGKQMKMWRPGDLADLSLQPAGLAAMQAIADDIGADDQPTGVYVREGEGVVLYEGREQPTTVPAPTGGIRRVVVTSSAGGVVAEVVAARQSAPGLASRARSL